MSADKELPEMDAIDPQSPRSNAPNIFLIIWQRKALVFLGVFIALIGGGLYYAQRPPQYQSGAQVLLIKKNPDISMSGPGQTTPGQFMEDYMSTHSVLIKSQTIVNMAAQSEELKGGLQSFPDAG